MNQIKDSILDRKLRSRRPRLGVIPLGIKVVSEKTGKEYPKATDYFVIEKFPDLVEHLGTDKPKELKVMFLDDDECKVLDLAFCRYGSSKGLVCRGDGETAQEVVVQNGKSGVLNEIECKGRECEHFVAEDCHMTGRLTFWIWGFPSPATWQIVTRSTNSIANLLSYLENLRAVAGRIKYIPLVLKLVETPVQDIKSGTKRNVYLLQLEDSQEVREGLRKLIDQGIVVPPLGTTMDKERKAIPEAIEEPPEEAETEELPEEEEPEEKLPFEEEEEEPEAEPETEPPPEPISGRQAGDFMKMLKRYGVSEEDAVAHAKESYGVSQIYQIPKDKARDFRDWVINTGIKPGR